MAETFQCPTCGGPLEYTQYTGPAVRCPYCLNTVIVPDELRGKRTTQEGIASQAQAQTSASPAPAIDPHQLESEIRQLLAARQKITAIKIYRQATGAGLKEAKDAVEAIGAGGAFDADRIIQLAKFDSMQMDEADIYNQATQLIRDGKKIEAIKLLRQQYDLSLKVAKDAADRIENGQMIDIEWLKRQANLTAEPSMKPLPDLSNQGANGFLPRGCVLLMVLGIGLILLAVLVSTLLR